MADLAIGSTAEDFPCAPSKPGFWRSFATTPRSGAYFVSHE